MPKIVEFGADLQRLKHNGFILSGKSGKQAFAVLVAPPRNKREGQQMIVVKGSEFGPLERTHTRDADRVFRRLLKDGLVAHAEDGSFVFKDHVLFASPQRAANLLLGSNRHGWLVWGHMPTAKPLDEVYERDRHGTIELVYFEKPPQAYEVPALD